MPHRSIAGRVRRTCFWTSIDAQRAKYSHALERFQRASLIAQTCVKQSLIEWVGAILIATFSV
jgi:hypothetical protein